MRYNNEQYSKLSKIKLNQIELKLSEQNDQQKRQDKIRYDIVRRAHTTSCL